MKTIKKCITWILISLVLQSGLYLYLDRVYFMDETHVKVTTMNTPGEMGTLKPDITFPEGVEQIGLSYDGRYASYFDGNGDLHVSPTHGSKWALIPSEDNAKCVACKWLPDSDIMVLAEALNLKSGKVIRFSSYDAGKEDKKEIGDFQSRKSTISVSGKNIKVDMKVSTLTGVMYVQVTSNNRSKIYRIDRNEKITRAPVYGSKVGTVQVASHDDLLAYEDRATHVVRTTADKKIIDINGVRNLQLLAADGNDNIYVGNNIDGKVTEVYYGKLSDSFSTWEEVTLDESVKPEDILITYKGEIYLRTGSGMMVEAASRKQVAYKGELIGICQNQVASVDNDRLVLSTMSA